jgi:hypothetical protein
MKRKHQKTLELIYARSVSGNIQWRDIEALFVELGAEINEREGSRIEVFLFYEVRVFHRPHPRPDTDKGAVASVREWFKMNGVMP